MLRFGIVLVLWLCLLVGETESLWQRSQALTARSTFSSSKALHRGYYHRRILQNRDIALTMGVDDNDEDDGFEGFEVVTPSKSSGASVVKPALSADQKKKFILATSAALLGIAYNVFQHTSEDGSSLALLKKMEVESVAFEVR